MPQEPRDGWDIVLVGGIGVLPPRDSECGVTLRGSSGIPGGNTFRGTPKNSTLRSGRQNAPMVPRQVAYSLGGGQRGVASVGLGMGQGFTRSLTAPGGSRLQRPAKK